VIGIVRADGDMRAEVRPLVRVNVSVTWNAMAAAKPVRRARAAARPLKTGSRRKSGKS
jgi:hypothetical protein